MQSHRCNQVFKSSIQHLILNLVAPPFPKFQKRIIICYPHKNIYFENAPITFLTIKSNVIYLSKSINKGSPGLENPEIIELGGSGPSHEETKILLDQIEAEEFPGGFKAHFS